MISSDDIESRHGLSEVEGVYRIITVRGGVKILLGDWNLDDGGLKEELVPL